MLAHSFAHRRNVAASAHKFAIDYIIKQVLYRRREAEAETEYCMYNTRIPATGIIHYFYTYAASM